MRKAPTRKSLPSGDGGATIAQAREIAEQLIQDALTPLKKSIAALTLRVGELEAAVSRSGPSAPAPSAPSPPPYSRATAHGTAPSRARADGTHLPELRRQAYTHPPALERAPQPLAEEPAADPPWEFFIESTISGATLKVQVQPTNTVLELKEWIEGEEGVPVSEQVITFEGRPLGDRRQLAECGVHPSAVLQLSSISKAPEKNFIRFEVRAPDLTMYNFRARDTTTAGKILDKLVSRLNVNWDKGKWDKRLSAQLAGQLHLEPSGLVLFSPDGQQMRPASQLREYRITDGAVLFLQLAERNPAPPQD
eukprot:tig00000403_g303.t1